MSISLPPFPTVVWGWVFLFSFVFLSFYSFLCRVKFPVGYRSCETVVGWEFSSALGPDRDWLCLFLPLLGWGRISCLSPPVYLLGRLGKLGQRSGLEPDWAPGFMDFCVSSAGTVPVTGLQVCTPSDHSSLWFPLGVPSQDTNSPALLILNTRRCKSHLTFSFRNCDLFFRVVDFC